MLLLFLQTRLLLCLKMLFDMRTLSRGGYRILSTAKVMLFVIKFNSWKPSTILKNITTSEVERILNPPLTKACTIVMSMVLDWKKVRYK